MKEQFVTYEIALALKELGFDCDYHFMEFDDMGILQQRGLLDSHGLNFIKAPLWQQAIDWFEKKHNLFITTIPGMNNEPTWQYMIYTLSNNDENMYEKFNLENNYMAREQAILKTIELCKK